MDYMTTILYYGLPIIGFIIVLLAQGNITLNYNKYKQVFNDKRLKGCDVARIILDQNGLSDIKIYETDGELTDHYDPSNKLIRLSNSIYGEDSVAAMSVAAHEVGHAIQDKNGYFLFRLRSMLVPVVNLVSYLGYFGLIVSVFAGITGYIKLSIIVLLASLLFQLVTLPVEFDASRRAKKELYKLGLVSEDERSMVRKMLFAAALTYVASLLSNILQLLRLVLLLRGRDD